MWILPFNNIVDVGEKIQFIFRDVRHRKKASGHQIIKLMLINSLAVQYYYGNGKWIKISLKVLQEYHICPSCVYIFFSFLYKRMQCIFAYFIYRLLIICRVLSWRLHHRHTYASLPETSTSTGPRKGSQIVL